MTERKMNNTVKGLPPLTVKNAYNGTVFNEYYLFLAPTKTDDSEVLPQDAVFLNCYPKPTKHSMFWKYFFTFNCPETNVTLKSFLCHVFLPQGYPHTVTDDYLEYQMWDTIQAFASSINGALATTAVFKSVGVGRSSASVLAASVTWLIKDGTGMIGRIIFAYAKGTFLDSDCKKWRLMADILNDFAFLIDIIASQFSSSFFMPMACISSLLRSVVGVAGAATRTSVVKHQARRKNLADVAAKDCSQETVVNLCSLFISLAILTFLNDRTGLVWLCFFMCTILHLFANYRAVRSLHLDVLNQTRFKLCLRHFVVSGNVLGVKECNELEPIFKNVRGKRLFGCALNKVPLNINLRRVVKNNATFCSYDEKADTGWIVLEADTSEDVKFSAVFQLEYFAIKKIWPTPEIESEFVKKLREANWKTHVYQLNFDEWRIHYLAQKQKKY